VSRKRYQTGEQNQRLFQIVQLDRLVPENHILRRIEAAVDFEFIRELVEDTYDQEAVRGRPPWDPVILFKMMLIGFLFDLSDHRLEQEVGMHAGYRWFLGLDFEDPVPDRTTLIKTRQRWGLDRFEAIFARILDQCAAAGLIRGQVLVADGTEIRARAATTSLEQQVRDFYEARTAANMETTASDDKPTDPPDRPPTHRQAGEPDFHGERFRNATHRSQTDPEARLYKKGRQREAFLRYLGHYVMDQQTGVVLCAAASQAYGTAETDVTGAVLADLRSAPYLAEQPRVYLDGGYRAGSFLADLLELGFLPLVRLQNPEPEPLPTWQRQTNRLDWFRQRQEKRRVAAARNTIRGQVQNLSQGFEAARVRIEHAFAEAKQWHGLGHARGYGLETCHWQVVMTGLTQNIKRLANYRGHRREGTSVSANPASSLAVQHLLRMFVGAWYEVFKRQNPVCCLLT